MIAKGTTHNNGVKLAQYMTTGKDGERAELWQLYGFAATSIKDAFRDVHIMADATKCEHPFFHVQVRNREGETLTRQQWETTAHRIMRINGLTGQPYAIAFHINELTGEEHMHLAVSTIDAETLKAKPLPFFKDRLKKISRELEKGFGLQPVKNERDSPIKYAPTRAQEEQARRLGVDIHEVRDTIRNCWDRSDNGRSFRDALEHEGLILAAGDQRGLVVIDHGGGIHALGKRILDMTPGQIKARMSDLDRDELPGVAEARAFVAELKAERLERENAAPVWDREQATVRDEIKWQEALDKAAIAKEKTERRFVEPERHAPAGPAEPARPPQTQAPAQAINDERTKDLRGPAAHVWAAWCQTDSDKVLAAELAGTTVPFAASSKEAFAASLYKRGISFAAVTKEEAERSYREAEFAKAVGNYAPRFKEAEIVIVTEQPLEYRRDGQIVVPARVHKLDQSLAEKVVKHLGTGSQLQGIDATLKASDQRAQQRAANWDAIREVYAESRLHRTREIATEKAIRAGAAKTKDAIHTSAAALGKAASVAGSLGKVFDVIGNAVDSLLSPTLTPQQIHDAEKAKDSREAEADFTIDFSRVTAEAAQQRQQQENEREAARQRQRDEGRGRDR